MTDRSFDAAEQAVLALLRKNMVVGPFSVPLAASIVQAVLDNLPLPVFGAPQDVSNLEWPPPLITRWLRGGAVQSDPLVAELCAWAQKMSGGQPPVLDNLPPVEVTDEMVEAGGEALMREAWEADPHDAEEQARLVLNVALPYLRTAP